MDHFDYLDLTNVIYNNVLKDAWSNDKLTRKQVKGVGTPTLYGSGQGAKNLWKKNKIEFTKEDIVTWNRELRTGRFKVANMFKDFIIKHCKPTEEMMVQIKDEKFSINCNRFYTVGQDLHEYSCIDTESDELRTFFNMKTVKVPNLEAFKVYFATLLVHNLDSQIADGMLMDLDGWMLDIHDAFLLHPAKVTEARKHGVKRVRGIRTNRAKILKNFFESVGIDLDNKMVWHDWCKLKEACNPVPKYTRFSGTCLK